MRQPTVSVVITSYNYARFIGETIESVLRQTYPVHEIIVVDDGSSDNSAEVIQSFGNRVKFILQQNQGVCVARNNGAKLATGVILAFLDSDDIWRPDKLERQVKALSGDEEAGLVSCGIRGFDNNGKTLYQYIEGKSGWCAKEILLFKPVINFTASAIALRRSIFEKVGGFDERRELFAAEDREFCYRVARAAKLIFLPEILVDYRVHGDNGHLNIAQMERALMLAYQKIFNQADDEIKAIQNESYGNVYSMLAASHFHAGNYRAFLRNSLKSIWLTPANMGYFIKFPMRLWKRKTEETNTVSY